TSAGVYPTAGGGGAPPAQEARNRGIGESENRRANKVRTREAGIGESENRRIGEKKRRDEPWISNTPPNRKPSVLKCEAGWRRIYRLTCAWTTPGMSALPRTTRPSSDDGHGKKPCIPLAGWASPGPSSMGEAGPVSSSR